MRRDGRYIFHVPSSPGFSEYPQFGVGLIVERFGLGIEGRGWVWIDEMVELIWNDNDPTGQ